MKINKFTYQSPKNIHDLWIQLAKHKSVYFWPLNRMMPTSFFKGYIWYDALYIHFEMGSFIFREERSIAGKIKSALEKIPVPA